MDLGKSFFNEWTSDTYIRMIFEEIITKCPIVFYISAIIQMN